MNKNTVIKYSVISVIVIAGGFIIYQLWPKKEKKSQTLFSSPSSGIASSTTTQKIDLQKLRNNDIQTVATIKKPFNKQIAK